MKINARTPRPTTNLCKQIVRVWLTAFMLLSLPVAGFAQEITGSVRGTVSAPTGEPEAGATVTVTDTRTGTTRSVTTNASGGFNVRNLTVGGPYTIRIASSSYEGTLITDVYTNLSGATNFSIQLEPQDSTIEEIVVVSSAVQTADLAIGPSSSFSLEEIRALPSISRQIRDIVRLDPRVNVGRANGGNGFGISCLGGSGRANSFTIDGVASADGFGLNASGNSARNTFPIPFDTVGSASVEFAPMDVQYGRFTGCNVNVITKSGSNKFTGSAFYLFNDESMTGDTLDGNIVISEPFEDKNYGFDVGGPIVKDKLFFYAAYEETDTGSAQNDGPAGAGFANETDITLAEAEQIQGILLNQYGRDTGPLVRTLPQTSERVFGRLDWNINDYHRAELTYTKLQEENVEPDDFGFVGFSFADNFELEGTDQEAISFRMFSDWTDRFSTEFRYSTLEVNDNQGPVGGGEAQDDNKPRIIVEDGAGNQYFISGPGQFRSANDLDYTLDQLKIAGHFELGDHTLTAGYERDALDVFNLFVVNGTGTITFDSIADLAAGTASGIDANGSFTGDINDAAANFDRNINTFYIQDTWRPTDSVTLVAGLRYDSYESSDAPIANPVFEQRYGFTNTTSFDGLDLLMPRLGLTWDLPASNLGEMQLRAGFGIFSGGDPTVHYANAFQNFGGAIGRGRDFNPPCAAADLQVLNGGTFTGIPPCIAVQQQAQAALNDGRADAVAPGFKLPNQNRFNLGFGWLTDTETNFFNAWDLQFDFIYSDHKDSLEFLDITLTQSVDAAGNPIFLPDGRPQFFAIDPLLPNCNATFNGGGLGFSGVTQDCDAGGDDQDILMTNGISGESISFSFQANKSFDFTDRTSMDFRFGYAYTDTDVGNPVNSSTATSGFEEVATAVINNNTLAPAQYTNKHNFVLGMNFRHFFMADHPTSVGLFVRRRSGRPFSYAYDNNTPTGVFGDSDNEERNLFYVPTGQSDPLVDLTALDADGTTQEFFDFLQRTGLNKYAGSISGRNAFQQQWTTDIDVRIQQDIPLPGSVDHRLKLFFDIENLLNLFSDTSNVQKFADNGDVGEAVPILDAALSADGSQYIYSNFNPGGSNSANDGFNPLDIDVDDSVWRIQLGIRYEFDGF